MRFQSQFLTATVLALGLSAAQAQVPGDAGARTEIPVNPNARTETCNLTQDAQWVWMPEAQVRARYGNEVTVQHIGSTEFRSRKIMVTPGLWVEKLYAIGSLPQSAVMTPAFVFYLYTNFHQHRLLGMIGQNRHYINELAFVPSTSFASVSIPARDSRGSTSFIESVTTPMDRLHHPVIGPTTEVSYTQSVDGIPQSSEYRVRNQIGARGTSYFLNSTFLGANGSPASPTAMSGALLVRPFRDRVQVVACNYIIPALLDDRMSRGSMGTFQTVARGRFVAAAANLNQWMMAAQAQAVRTALQLAAGTAVDIAALTPEQLSTVTASIAPRLAELQSRLTRPTPAW